MITVKTLMRLLAQCPSDAKVFAYEGEDTGIAVNLPAGEQRWIRATENDMDDSYTRGFVEDAALAWTTEKPTHPGRYKIRARQNEKVRIGSEEIKGEREVQIAYIGGMSCHGLSVFFELGVVSVAGLEVEFCGPLEPQA